MTADKLMFGFASGDSIPVTFMMDCLTMGVAKQEHCDLTHLRNAKGLYVGENRNRLVQYAKEAEVDWLLMVDPDVLFRPTLPSDLVAVAQKHNAKIVAVDVPQSTDTPTSAYKVDDGHWVPCDCEKSGFHDGASSSVLLVHRDVFTSFDPCFMDLYAKQGVHTTEDLVFCERAAKVGFRTWVETGVPVCHVKAFPLPNKAFMASVPKEGE